MSLLSLTCPNICTPLVDFLSKVCYNGVYNQERELMINYLVDFLKRRAQVKHDKARRAYIKRTTGFSDTKIDEIEARLEGKV